MNPLPLHRLSPTTYEATCDACLVTRAVPAADAETAAVVLYGYGWSIVDVARGYRPQWRCPEHLGQER